MFKITQDQIKQTQIKQSKIKLSQLMIWLFVTMISVWSISCDESSTSNKKSDIEKKLMSSTWYGVYTFKGYDPFISLAFFAKTIKLKDNGIADINYCGEEQFPWKYTNEEGVSYLNLTLGNVDIKKYKIKRLTTDTILLQDNEATYILQKNSKVYNNVKIQFTYDNGQPGISFPNKCVEEFANEIKEYNFVLGGAFPNPCTNSSYIEYKLGINSNVKILLDDGTNSQELINKLYKSGMYSIDLDVKNKVNGVYRITCYVKPVDKGEEKSISTYVFVAR